MIIIFDLDDTLYSEITYVKSGLMTVSIFLEKNFDVDNKTAYLKMYEYLKKPNFFVTSENLKGAWGFYVLKLDAF